MSIRVLFFGTAEFAIPSLKKLVLEMPDVELVGVVTQPDRPAGRKQTLKVAAVKQFLIDKLENSAQFEVRIYQPEKLKKEFEEILEDTEPDLIVTAAYGQIIPKGVIDYPEHGCLNIHGSLLPMYRGAVPLEMALLNGDEQTGVSILKMTPRLDDGPVVAEKALKIAADADAVWLRQRAAKLGAELLLDTLPNWVAGRIEAIPQAKLEETTGRPVSYCKVADLSREKAEISSSDSASVALRKVKAFAASRGAWLKVYRNNKPMAVKIWSAEVLNENKNMFNWGKFFEQGTGLVLNLKIGQLLVHELQLEGKNRASWESYRYLAEDTNQQVRVLLVVGNEALFIKRRKYDQRYVVLPGGHVKKGESLISAALRELREETSVSLQSDQLSEVLVDQDLSGDRAYYYKAQISEKPKVAMIGEEVARSDVDNTFELRWLPLNAPELKQFEPNALRHRLFKLE